MTSPRPFLVLTSPRTGSTLLVDMLRSHPQITAGGELFNAGMIRDGVIDWPDPAVRTDPGLVALRERDPVAFVDRIYELACRTTAQVAGFKILYEQALEVPRLLEYLGSLAHVKVIHLRRRNLLHQLVSLRRAAASGEWHRKLGKPPAARMPPPAIELELSAVTGFLQAIEEQHARFARFFAQHAILPVDYEDLAEDPQGTGARVLEFLGVEARALALGYERTGTRPLAEVVANWADLRATFARWAAFFEDGAG